MSNKETKIVVLGKSTGMTKDSKRREILKDMNASDVPKEFIDVIKVYLTDGEGNLYKAICEISEEAYRFQKPLIMATENLESMQKRLQPSKSEIIAHNQTALNTNEKQMEISPITNRGNPLKDGIYLGAYSV